MKTKKNRTKILYSLAFLVSAAFLAYSIFNHQVWLTLALPFVVTSFVKALDIL